MAAILSIFIPCVFENVANEAFIRETFNSLELGQVNCVDFVARPNSQGSRNTIYFAYIHFDFWYPTKQAKAFQERVKDPNKDARLVYDDPSYWVCLENKGSKRDYTTPKVRINLSSILDQEQVEKQVEAQVEKQVEAEDNAWLDGTIFQHEELEEVRRNFHKQQEIDAHKQQVESVWREKMQAQQCEHMQMMQNMQNAWFQERQYLQNVINQLQIRNSQQENIIADVENINAQLQATINLQQTTINQYQNDIQILLEDGLPMNQDIANIFLLEEQELAENFQLEEGEVEEVEEVEERNVYQNM